MFEYHGCCFVFTVNIILSKMYVNFLCWPNDLALSTILFRRLMNMNKRPVLLFTIFTFVCFGRLHSTLHYIVHYQVCELM